MCFELDSLPPIPVLSGASVSHRDLVLEAHDGNRLAAFAATPDEPNGSGVVVLPDVRGLYRFYEELALRRVLLRRTALVALGGGRKRPGGRRRVLREARTRQRRRARAGAAGERARGADPGP